MNGKSIVIFQVHLPVCGLLFFLLMFGGVSFSVLCLFGWFVVFCFFARQ